MADLEHVDLTDPNLHEPKGVSAAAVDTVYVADGTGSGDWEKVGPDAMTDAAKPFSDQMYQAKRVANYAVTAASTWNTVAFTTEVTDDLTASISGGALVLPAGTYYVDGWLSHYVFTDVGVATGRLYNSTTSTELVRGAGVAGTDSIIVPVRGRFTLASSSNVIAQVYSSKAGQALTTQTGEFTNSCVADFTFWRVTP